MCGLNFWRFFYGWYGWFYGWFYGFLRVSTVFYGFLRFSTVFYGFLRVLRFYVFTVSRFHGFTVLRFIRFIRFSGWFSTVSTFLRLATFWPIFSQTHLVTLLTMSMISLSSAGNMIDLFFF
jgi:hypothetical protein